MVMNLLSRVSSRALTDHSKNERADDFLWGRRRCPAFADTQSPPKSSASQHLRRSMRWRCCLFRCCAIPWWTAQLWGPSASSPCVIGKQIVKHVIAEDGQGWTQRFFRLRARDFLKQNQSIAKTKFNQYHLSCWLLHNTNRGAWLRFILHFGVGFYCNVQRGLKKGYLLRASWSLFGESTFHKSWSDD